MHLNGLDGDGDDEPAPSALRGLRSHGEEETYAPLRKVDTTAAARLAVSVAEGRRNCDLFFFF